ncbi:MAG: 2Fe-2S iron-sulfur cluster binding domain-containing protein, partial [Kordiimonadaceae bacterium]|nr:2Fe-2S iron-sulfur cluster binding domain-containing protein [Kordiimonadaceae bacterium]
RRTYTLSSAPKMGGALRLTIKANKDGYVSRYVAEGLKVGDTVHAHAPAGDFTLQSKSEQSSVFISAGIGITPMIAMAESLLDADSTALIRFLHASTQPAGTAFLADFRRWNQQYSNFDLAVAFSGLQDSDKPFPGALFPGAFNGRMTADWLSAQKLPLDGAFYLCGPQRFMQMVYDCLLENGVADEQIHFEAFGPSSLQRANPRPKKTYAPVEVQFTASDETLMWNATDKSLLEVAEDNGIEAPFSCRTGSCGSCAVKLLTGKVTYEKIPAFPAAKDEVLVCCAVPVTDNADEPLAIEL